MKKIDLQKIIRFLLEEGVSQTKVVAIAEILADD